LGKSECDSQQIPEDILIEKINEVCGLEAIEKITVPGKFQLAFTLKGGTEKSVEWRHKSRRESWTPAMRAEVSEKARARNGKS